MRHRARIFFILEIISISILLLVPIYTVFYIHKNAKISHHNQSEILQKEKQILHNQNKIMRKVHLK